MPKTKTMRKTRRTQVRRAAKAPQGRFAAVTAALGTTEAEIQKQLKRLMKQNKVRVEDASRLLKDLQTRADKERRRAAKELESRFHEVQKRVAHERKALVRFANEAVQSALAGLNIPSRREIAELTRKVEELSRKIDALKRR
jgi:polyhydroxyalkanoate synthesis regulator phasin